jgi:ferric-dicitrate binding protein FerR (iron transport regulator)
LRLVGGAIAIEFDSGAELVVEAPAEFAPRAKDQVDLRLGRLFARVPQGARGFVVDTPLGRAVDLGTQFGIRVESSGVSEVHLFKGRLALAPLTARRGNKPILLSEEQAKQVSIDGLVRDIPLARRDFVRMIDPCTGLIWRG